MKTAFRRALLRQGLKPSLCLFASGLILTGPGTIGSAAVDAGLKDETFKLNEVSAFEQHNDNLLRGQYAACGDKPLKEVKAYPAFTSKKPLYGSFRLSEARNASRIFCFAIDESKGSGKGYDLLYFDANLDLDLRNDPVLKKQAHPPARATTHFNPNGVVCFDFLAVPFDFGPAGTRLVEMLPRLNINVYGSQEYKQMTFVRTKICQGDIKIAGEDYKALLGNSYSIHGRLDAPGTVLLLTSSRNRTGKADWWGGDSLKAAHKIHGRFYTFSASPTGDELTVHPYKGDLGTFEIGPGGRKLEAMTATGSLEAKNLAVAVGGDVEDGSPREARRCQIPVGDYRPNYIGVEFGRLHIAMSFNYHSDGNPRGYSDRPAVYGITIRKDKPFVFDFSNKPEVMFASPAKNQRIKRGDELEVKAVLIDPQLDIMIRGLDDTSRKQTKTPEGQPLGYERNFSLDPKVLITRLNGEKVAEGVMPFG